MSIHNPKLIKNQMMPLPTSKKKIIKSISSDINEASNNKNTSSVSQNIPSLPPLEYESGEIFTPHKNNLKKP